MRYNVLWMEVAQIDLQSVYEYIAIDSEQHAVKVYRSIKSSTKMLEDFPESGQIVPELAKQNISGIRQVVFMHWRVIYKVFESKIHIEAVIDSRRNIEGILNNRFLNRRPE